MTAPADPVVFVVDDDATMRRGLSRLLRSRGYAVETFPSAEAYLTREPHRGLGCVLLDVCMPGMDGLRLQEELLRSGQALPIVFLTAHAEVPVSVHAIKRGAVDFLTKPVDELVLLETVRAAIAKCSLDSASRTSMESARVKVASLTSREREVLLGVLSGALNKQIALKLNITEATVKVHRGHIMQKLRATSVADLVRLCEKAGIQLT